MAFAFVTIGESTCQAQLDSVPGKPETNHPESKFRALDTNSDGELTESEFATEGSRPENVLGRDFKVFDVDQNGRMNMTEFLCVPYCVPEAQRGVPFDNVESLVEKSLNELIRHWMEWDQNADGTLDSKEFENAAMGKLVPGLEKSTWTEWDLDHDMRVTKVELRQFLDIAFGVKTAAGEVLRSKFGWVVDWRVYRNLKKDQDGFVNREAYFQVLGGMEVKTKQEWFESIDKNHDGKFDFDEFSKGMHHTDPVATFLDLDKDLNGKLSAGELEALPGDRFPVGNFLIPGFDDNKDGSLSLAEFHWTPVIHLLIYCNTIQDTNADGKLSLDEFRVDQSFWSAALGAEYFRRFDTDKDQSLSLDEFPFVTNHPSGSEIEINVVFADDSSIKITIPDYPIICSPEISPNGKWVAVDGWKHGQNNVAAHILVASLETDEVRDLGIGCIPHWSADGKRIAYSKYSGGVFLRDFEGTADDEECLDRQGWAIHFSTDGLKTAYVKNQGNIVIHDIKSGTKKVVFPEGTSPYNYIEHNFCWSPDSKRICFKGHRHDGTTDVGIVSTTGGDPNLHSRWNGNDVQSDFTWLSDGKRIMFPRSQPSQKTQIFELDPDNDKPPVRYPRQPKNRNNGGLCWSRDGKTFVFMSTR